MPERCDGANFFQNLPLPPKREIALVATGSHRKADEVQTIEEATTLLSTDPAIQEKLLDAELFQWYGSAALPEYLKAHEKIEKKKM